MSTPAFNPAEERRLQALADLGLLDTAVEQAYDDIAALASQICGTPIALMSLVDRDRQWFKASIGLAERETPRSVSFCAHAIETPDSLFVVADATGDARFAANPLVTGEPRVRFYAGMPIVTADGLSPGAVCVIDTVPRQLDESQREALRRLARQAGVLLDLRGRTRQAATLAAERDAVRAEAELGRHKSGELLELVLRGGDLGLWDLDLGSGHWTTNPREREMLGYGPEDARPDKLDWKSLIHPEDWPGLSRIVGEHLRGLAPYIESTHRLRHRDGHWVWVLDRSVVVQRDLQGRPLRVVGTHMDVTAQKLSEEARRKNEERLELALSGGNIGLWDMDIRTGLVTYNDAWWQMFGYPPEERQAREGLWRGIVHHDDHEASRLGLQRHIDGQTPIYEGEVRVRHRQGRWLWIQTRAKVVERDAEGRALRIVGVTINITGEKHTRDLLERTSALAKVGGWEVDLATRTLTWADEVFRIHDLEPGPPPTLEQAFGYYAEPARPVIAAAIEEAVASGNGWDLELPIVTAQGREIWVRAIGHVELDGGRPSRLLGTVQDVTELKRRQLLLDALAGQDALTGLPNRRSFESRAADAATRALETGAAIGLMYLDVDNFKTLNDAHGHAGGDAVLKEFGRRLELCLGADDMAARIAGDEFVILLAEVTDETQARQAASKVMDVMHGAFQVLGKALKVTASIGIALSDGDEDLSEMLARADAALYDAKNSGRNRYRLHAALGARDDESVTEFASAFGSLDSLGLAPPSGATNRRPLVGNLIGNLASAMATPAFTIAFQPIVDPHAREVFAYEALVRGIDGEGAAQVLGRVPQEERLAFHEACRLKAIEMAAKLGMRTHLSLNVDPSDLKSGNRCFLSAIRWARRFGFPSEHLIFEMTEGERVDDLPALVAAFRSFRHYGLMSAIDDFGAAYSSFDLLAGFQPDVVKIDMKLVRDIHRHPVQRTLVKNFVEICAELQIRLVAEGVETVEEFEVLRDLGVPLFQGYLFARPAIAMLPPVAWQETVASASLWGRPDRMPS